MLRQVDAGLPVAHGARTVGDLLDEWQAKVLAGRDLAGSTETMYAWALARLREDLGSRRLVTLRVEDVENALQVRADGSAPTVPRSGRGRSTSADGLSRRSLRTLRQVLAAAITWAERRGYVARNVAAIAELPTTARRPTERRSMTADELRRFLAAAEGSPYEAMFVAMAYLGLRPGEAAGLAWADVDFDNGVVHICRARKVAANGAPVIGTTKNPGSVRSLDAPLVVLDAPTRQRAAQNVLRLAVGPTWANEAGLAFTTRTGRPTDPGAVRRAFRKVLADAAVAGFTLHELRHTAASIMVGSIKRATLRPTSPARSASPNAVRRI